MNADEKHALAAHIPRVDLDAALLHDGQVPWYLAPGFVGITLRNRIYFRAGVYDPRTDAGLALLGHELIHVGQFRRGMTYARYLCACWRGYRHNRYEIEAYAAQARLHAALRSRHFGRR